MEKLEHLKRDLSAVIDFLLERTSTFGVSEWFSLKLFLLSMGTLIGSSFSKFFKKLKPLLTIVMLISGIFTFIRVFAPVFDNIKEK